MRQSPGTVPVGYPIPLGDVSGGLYAAISIVAALLHREHTGEGSYIDVALAASAMSLMVIDASRAFRPDQPRPPAPRAGHDIGLLQCRDGRWLSTGNVETVFWENFCGVLDRREWIPLLNGSEEDARQMGEEVRQLFLTKPRDEWLDILANAETCVAPVNDIVGAMADPQMNHVGMVLEMRHPTEGMIRQLGFPVRVSGQSVPRDFAPVLGRDTRDVLRRLGYPEDEISALERQEIVYCAR